MLTRGSNSSNHRLEFHLCEGICFLKTNEDYYKDEVWDVYRKKVGKYCIISTCRYLFLLNNLNASWIKIWFHLNVYENYCFFEFLNLYWYYYVHNSMYTYSCAYIRILYKTHKIQNLEQVRGDWVRVKPNTVFSSN